MALAISSSVTAQSDAAQTSLTSPSITCPSGGRLWVFSGWDTTEQAYTIASTPSLTWNVVTAQAGAGETGGDVRVWYADCPSGFTGTVTLTKGVTNYAGESMWVGAITGGEATPGGAVVLRNGQLPMGDITTTQANSIVIASCANWAGAAMSSGVGWTNTGATNQASQTELLNHRTAGQYQHVCWRRNGLLAVGTYEMDLMDDDSFMAGDFVEVEIREGSSSPSMTAELYENGSFKQTLGVASITGDGVYAFTWTAGQLAAISGSNVELRLTSDADIDIGAIEWNAKTETPSGNVFAKTGSGVLNLVGAGVQAKSHVYPKTGAGVLSPLSASGAKAVTHPKTGSGILNGAAGGAKAVEHPKSGISAVVMVGAGAKAVTHPKTGAGILNLVGSGTKTVTSPTTWTKTGSGILNLVGSGVQQRVHSFPKTGLGVLNLAASGTKTVAHTYTKTGAGVLNLAAGGVQQQAHQHAKTGSGVLNLVGSGDAIHTNVDAGSGVLNLAAGGTKVVTHVKTGSGVLTGAASGPKSVTHPKTGGAALNLVGSGPKVLNKVWVKQNLGPLDLLPSGAKSVDHPKTGLAFLTFAGSGTGGKVSAVPPKFGTGVLNLVGSGPEAKIIDKTGLAYVTFLGAGVSQVEHTRAGSGAMVLAGSGTKTVQRIWVKYGTGVMGGGGGLPLNKVMLVGNKLVRAGRGMAHVL